MASIILLARLRCPVCEQTGTVGTVQVHLPSRATSTAAGVVQIPCPVCSGGDLEGAIRILRSRARQHCEAP
jgi:RecJ-like exonuclease